jgi:phosphoribosylformimino-5-aminoimidazole carboxamide ribotide isomerase
MIVIPAVDLLDGNAVRLLQGDPTRKTVFSHDPLEVARSWHQQGAERLHVVDLNGSFSGAPLNGDLIEAITQAIPIPVQLGGGIRDLETVGAYLGVGVDRVILGTAAVEQPDIVVQACGRWPGRIAVALDARGGRVTVQGWTEGTSLQAVDLARRFEGIGVAALIYTDVERDGMEHGPNLEATRTLVRSVDIPVIASGGVASLNDIRALLEIAPEGIEGVIVGRALYSGSISLEQAICLTREGSQ